MDTMALLCQLSPNYIARTAQEIATMPGQLDKQYFHATRRHQFTAKRLNAYWKQTRNYGGVLARARTQVCVSQCSSLVESVVFFTRRPYIGFGIGGFSIMRQRKETPWYSKPWPPVDLSFVVTVDVASETSHERKDGVAQVFFDDVKQSLIVSSDQGI